ncbi:FxsA protein [Paramagnetospirillum magnetotacticum MS-1]|uniref:FxsA protein n=1 Tax=Paramagnetospirillum magnetotacticum MS-1 TaxID=272627 RepID=A0A0C2YT32_PARME|nr:FxsA family protein [Paramagnetospirillum magnetotacticum]KIL97885.1 FxsA protein [Paramagnetospirillum magnetotacticum MS-1]
MAWAFLVGLLTLPVAEIMVWIKVSESIGGLATVGLTILAILAGSALLRHGRLGVALDLKSRLERGDPPGPAVFDGICLTLAGVLLMLPGFISDGFALLLLLPPVRALLLQAIVARAVVIGAQAPASSSGPTVIDGDYQIITPESEPKPPTDHKRLEP